MGSRKFLPNCMTPRLKKCTSYSTGYVFSLCAFVDSHLLLPKLMCTSQGDLLVFGVLFCSTFVQTLQTRAFIWSFQQGHAQFAHSRADRGNPDPWPRKSGCSQGKFDVGPAKSLAVSNWIGAPQALSATAARHHDLNIDFILQLLDSALRVSTLSADSASDPLVEFLSTVLCNSILVLKQHAFVLGEMQRIVIHKDYTSYSLSDMLIFWFAAFLPYAHTSSVQFLFLSSSGTP